MIVTPKEIQSWIDKKKEFTVIDIRPDKFQNKNPILGLKCISSDENSIITPVYFNQITLEKK